MKKICLLSKIALSLTVLGALTGCAHSPKKPFYGVQPSDAVPEKACENNAYLKQYGCSLQNVEQAAQSNEPDAEYALGYMYYNGIGTVKDTDTAVVWISRAASQGQPLAISALKTIRQAQFPTMGQVNMVGEKHGLEKKSLQVPVQSQKVSPSNVLVSQSVVSMDKIQNMPANHFTVQLFASPHSESVRRLEKSLPHNVPMMMTSIQKQGETWYVLFAGNFATRQEATAYVTTLPAFVKNAGPWIRTFESLKK